MAAKFKIGDEVKQIIVPVEGQILSRSIVGDDDVYLVGWTDAEGNVQQTHFKEDDIELVVV